MKGYIARLASRAQAVPSAAVPRSASTTRSPLLAQDQLSLVDGLEDTAFVPDLGGEDMEAIAPEARGELATPSLPVDEPARSSAQNASTESSPAIAARPARAQRPPTPTANALEFETSERRFPVRVFEEQEIRHKVSEAHFEDTPAAQTASAASTPDLPAPDPFDLSNFLASVAGSIAGANSEVEQAEPAYVSSTLQSAVAQVSAELSGTPHRPTSSPESTTQAPTGTKIGSLNIDVVVAGGEAEAAPSRQAVSPRQPITRRFPVKDRLRWGRS